MLLDHRQPAWKRHAALLRGFAQLPVGLLMILQHLPREILDLLILRLVLRNLCELHLVLIVDRGTDEEKLVGIVGGLNRGMNVLIRSLSLHRELATDGAGVVR